MAVMFHICTRADWEQGKLAGAFSGDRLHLDGFIHCATPEQVDPVASRRYMGKPGLVVLEIDRDRVKPPVRDEDNGKGIIYPHIYGPLNLDAVLSVRDFYKE